MLAYNERAQCKAAALIDGVLFKGERVNTDFLSKLRWSDKITAIHLLSFRTMGRDGQGINPFIEQLALLEKAMTDYGILVASLRVNVYDPTYDDSINADIARRLHALLRWPQRYLSVVYSHPTQNIPYMLAMNGADLFYHAGQPVDYKAAKQIAA